MAKAPKEYTRLPGRGMRRDGLRSAVGARAVYSIWLGRDHALLVERNGYNEDYKRFYFTDIQAVIMRRTPFPTVFSLVMGGIALFFFLWALNVANLPGRVALWIFGGSFALLCLIDLLRGPPCVTHIQTAVQREQIPCWGRIRTARRGMARLRPRLQEAQGVLSPEELKERWLGSIKHQGQSPATEPT